MKNCNKIFKYLHKHWTLFGLLYPQELFIGVVTGSCYYKGPANLSGLVYLFACMECNGPDLGWAVFLCMRLRGPGIIPGGLHHPLELPWEALLDLLYSASWWAKRKKEEKLTSLFKGQACKHVYRICSCSIGHKLSQDPIQMPEDWEMSFSCLPTRETKWFGEPIVLSLPDSIAAQTELSLAGSHQGVSQKVLSPNDAQKGSLGVHWAVYSCSHMVYESRMYESCALCTSLSEVHLLLGCGRVTEMFHDWDSTELAFTVVLRVCQPDHHHWHRLGTCQKYRFLGFTADLLNLKLRAWSWQSVF